jgi:hypothetical protein
MTPAAPPEPMTVENAFIPRTESTPADDRSTQTSVRPKPLVVINPYFDGGSLATRE